MGQIKGTRRPCHLNAQRGSLGPCCLECSEDLSRANRAIAAMRSVLLTEKNEQEGDQKRDVILARGSKLNTETFAPYAGRQETSKRRKRAALPRREERSDSRH